MCFDMLCVIFINALQAGYKNSADNILKYFYFSQKIGFDISCKLTHKEMLCMTFQSLFYWEIKMSSFCHLLNKPRKWQRLTITFISGVTVPPVSQYRVDHEFTP